MSLPTAHNLVSQASYSQQTAEVAAVPADNMHRTSDASETWLWYSCCVFATKINLGCRAVAVMMHQCMPSQPQQTDALVTTACCITVCWPPHGTLSSCPAMHCLRRLHGKGHSLSQPCMLPLAACPRRSPGKPVLEPHSPS